MEVETRTFHKVAGAKYVLPNDAPEMERLQYQHEGIMAAMNGKPIHAPVNQLNPKTIIDIGCGNAVMTRYLAKMFPGATVYGVDLTPRERSNDDPVNVEYIQGNVIDLVGKDPRLQAGSADFVFSRLLAAGMSDWGEYLETVSRLLKKGGWVEMHDSFEKEWYDSNGECVSKDWDWLHRVHEEVLRMGMSTETFDDVYSKAQRLGFARMEDRVYLMPYGKVPNAESLGVVRNTGLAMFQSWKIASAWVWKGRRSDDEIASLLEDMTATIGPESKGSFTKLRVLWAEKP